MDLEVTDKPSRQAGSDEVKVSQSVETKVEVWAERHSSESIDKVANETAVALVYNGVSHVVMMASPQDLEAFALGFSLTEGIVERAEDIYEVQLRAPLETPNLACP